MTAVPADVLQDRLWGEQPPGQASATLRSYISRVNHALNELFGADARIVRHGRGYQLCADPQTVDLHRFRSLAAQAEAVFRTGDSEQAAAMLREADSLWRGAAFGGLTSEWAERVRVSLEEERYATRLRRIGMELRLGRPDQLISELAELSAVRPFDEALAGLYMTALYRCGRQAEALRLYQGVRRRLAEEGLDPGAELNGLHQRMLQHDPGLSPPAAPRPPELAPGCNTLPPEAGPFVGRAAELRALTAASEQAGTTGTVCFIDGMAGIGKTALALQVARAAAASFPDAQLYLNCQANDPAGEPLAPGEIIGRLLQMVGGPASASLPALLSDRVSLWQATLARQRMVVVLDDVLGPEQIEPLMPRSPGCFMIVTSRRRWPGGDGTGLTTLGVLPEDEALTLFAQAAGVPAADATGSVAPLARLCGGLPLAIQVMGGFMRHSGVNELPGLIESLSSVNHGQRHDREIILPVMAAFEISYRGLSPAHRRFFRYLGISPCREVTLHSAVALSGGALTDTETAIAALLDHHLLEQISPGRFRLHDLVHVFACDRSIRTLRPGQQRQAIGRLIDYYRRTLHIVRHLSGVAGAPGSAVGHSSPPLGPDLRTAAAAQQWLDAEWRNVLLTAAYATRHERKEQCADLTHALAGFLDAGGNWVKAIDAHRLALQASHDLGDRARAARAAFDLSTVLLRSGEKNLALEYARQASALYREVNDRNGHAAALDSIGVIHRHSGRFRDALAHHQEAMDIYMATDNRRGLAEALVHAGSAYGRLGRYDNEVRHLNEALHLYRQVGDNAGQAKTLNNIGAVLTDQGYHRDAILHYQQALTVHQELGASHGVAMLHHNIGKSGEYRGELQKALAAYRDAISVYQQMGDRRHLAYAWCDTGSVYFKMDRHSEAHVHYDKALAIAEEIDDPSIRARALSGAADAYRGLCCYERAMDLYEQALRLAREIEDPHDEAMALSGMGETLLRIQGPEDARICWRQALELCQQMNLPEAESIRLRMETLDL